MVICDRMSLDMCPKSSRVSVGSRRPSVFSDVHVFQTPNSCDIQIIKLPLR